MPQTKILSLKEKATTNLQAVVIVPKKQPVEIQLLHTLADWSLPRHAQVAVQVRMISKCLWSRKTYKKRNAYMVDDGAVYRDMGRMQRDKVQHRSAFVSSCEPRRHPF